MQIDANCGKLIQTAANWGQLMQIGGKMIQIDENWGNRYTLG